jgi:phospholipase A-2-activating protein
LHSLSSLDPEAIDCLIGHSLNVCVLDYSPRSKKLVSGSWDHTARVWSRDTGKWSIELVLEGHEEAVWGVIQVDKGPKSGCIITGEFKYRLS